FTKLAEGMKPEEVSALLDRYFEILFGIVERHGGVVTDVVGDGMTCVWTAPAEDRSCRLKACHAALEIQRTLAGLGREQAPIGLATRIGLNAGFAVIGNVGGSGRFIYSVVGDVANTAARLETLNKQLGTRLLGTAAAVGDLAELVVRPLGRLQMFGKREVLPIVEIVGRAGEPHDRALLASFADALDAFQEQRWPKAAARFEAILDAHPSDGPSRFYLEQCRRYLSGAAAPEAPGLLRLERK
ncbi:MAG: adenylate/guanylate cyclase domain-containing protein, partial [Geminicoccales bacterium]